MVRVTLNSEQMVEEVQGTIDWAKDKLDAFPKAKKDLGPLLDALGRKSNGVVKVLAKVDCDCSQSP